MEKGHIGKRKWITAFILVLCMSFLVCTSAFASSTCEEDETMPVNQTLTRQEQESINIVRRYAEEWIKLTYSSEGTQVDEIIPIHNQFDKLNGYCVSFKKYDRPNGYIILKTDDSTESPLVEFSTEGEDAYDTLFKDCDENLLTNGTQKTLYNFGDYFYRAKVSSGQRQYILSPGNQLSNKKNLFDRMTTSALKNDDDRIMSAASTHPDHFASIKKLSTVTNIMGDKIITNAANFTPKNMNYYYLNYYNDTGEQGNCVPTALMNIIDYYRTMRGKSNLFLNASRTQSYKKLIQYLGKENNVTNLSALAGFSDYVLFRNYEPYAQIEKLNSWSSIGQQLDSNYTVFTLVRGYDATGVEKGHAIVAYGYITGRDTPTSSPKYYLHIWDGWDTTVKKVVLFSGFPTIYGYRVSVE